MIFDDTGVSEAYDRDVIDLIRAIPSGLAFSRPGVSVMEEYEFVVPGTGSDPLPRIWRSDTIVAMPIKKRSGGRAMLVLAGGALLDNPVSTWNVVIVGQHTPLLPLAPVVAAWPADASDLHENDVLYRPCHLLDRLSRDGVLTRIGKTVRAFLGHCCSIKDYSEGIDHPERTSSTASRYDIVARETDAFGAVVHYVREISSGFVRRVDLAMPGTGSAILPEAGNGWLPIGQRPGDADTLVCWNPRDGSIGRLPASVLRPFSVIIEFLGPSAEENCVLVHTSAVNAEMAQVNISSIVRSRCHAGQPKAVVVLSGHLSESQANDIDVLSMTAYTDLVRLTWTSWLGRIDREFVVG